ncbi:MAG TPA: barstar family protein [Thermomicrobiales bacterium]|nr:barstar family protein [Thermomicrobiales bacterium]
MADHGQPTLRFADRPRPGLYVVPSLPFAAGLLADAAAARLTTARIDLAPVATKAAFLAECARRLDFPPYFGHNWDAFDECFRDLAWQAVPGHAFLLAGCDRFAEAAPDDWRIALRIFESATAEWAEAGKPLYVFLQGSPQFAPGAPALSPTDAAPN